MTFVKFGDFNEKYSPHFCMVFELIALVKWLLSPLEVILSFKCVCNSYCSHLSPSTALHLRTPHVKHSSCSLHITHECTNFCHTSPPNQLLWEQVLYVFLYS